MPVSPTPIDMKVFSRVLSAATKVPSFEKEADKIEAKCQAWLMNCASLRGEKRLKQLAIAHRGLQVAADMRVALLRASE